MNLLRKLFTKTGKVQSNNVHKFDDKNENRNNIVQRKKQRKGILKNIYIVKMFNLLKEFLIFCLILMTYSAVVNDPPKVSKPPAAYPFFPENTIVKDFYRGQLISAIEHATSKDLSFIMFYAPWDAESQFARKEVTNAASFMKDLVRFTAINCWHPQSECKTKYSKVFRWPVLIAYFSNGNGIPYNGPISAFHINSFLYKLMRPIKRFTNNTILNYEEAYVLAEINTLPKSYEYSVYYYVALKYLEADYSGKIKFYVNPVKNSTKKITLHMWNQINIYDVEAHGWNVESILKWIIKSVESPSMWIAPTGSKSLILSDILQPGPSLIMFTPKNPLHLLNDYYMMLQQVAQEYKNCGKYVLKTDDISSRRLNNFLEYRKLQKNCYSKKNSQYYANNNKFMSVTTIAPFLNSTNLMQQERKLIFHCDRGNSQNFYNCENFDGSNECLDPKSVISTHISGSFYPTSMIMQHSDAKSMQNLRKELRREECRRFLAAEKFSAAMFVPIINNSNNESLNLICNNNESLTFLAMDSLKYSIFAERLGVDLSAIKDKSAVIILNQKMESHYIMQGPINSVNLRKFINNFSNNSLKRSLQSIVDVPSLKNPPKNSNKSVSSVKIEELNHQNFLETVHEDNKVVLVLYYSKECAYCSGISYAFLTVARKLSLVDNIIFRRIDGEINILPWEYTMEEFPTILFFPAKQKDESRVFPSEIQITVPNLLGFIMANVDKTTKLRIIYSICVHSQLLFDKNKCFANLRNEILSFIEFTLKDWRKSDKRLRRLILFNLQQLRQLQFLISHYPNKQNLIQFYFKSMKTYFPNNNNYKNSANNNKLIENEL